MPQLSSQALLGAAVGLAGARLYALLANSHVHAWELHLRRPPSFAVREGWRAGWRAGGLAELLMPRHVMDATAPPPPPPPLSQLSDHSHLCDRPLTLPPWHARARARVHVRRPPTHPPACLDPPGRAGQGAWTHLSKEGCVSLALMDGGSVRAGVAERLGLPLCAGTGVPRDTLLLGTQSGDCIFVDCTR